jgi:hypothetical protein
MKRNLLTCIWTGILLGATGTLTAQAASTIITFSVDMATNIADGSFNPPPPAGTGADTVGVFGTFNGYAPGFQLFQVGDSTIYTNTYDDTSDPNGTPVAYRFFINNTDNLEPLSCYDNRAAYTPTNSGDSLLLPTAFYGGNGPVIATTVKFQVDMSQEIQLGNFMPDQGNTVVIAGSFNGWSPTAGSEYVLTNDPSILVTNYNFGISGGLVESNVYTATIPITTCANTGTGSGGLAVTNEIQEWKYVEMPGSGWETPGPANDDHSSNRFFIGNTNKILPLVDFGDKPFTPNVKVTLNVDMSGVIRFDPNYVPDSVSVWGTFNGWASGLPLTNNPAAVNSNVFSGVITVGQDTSYIYQFRYTNSILNGWVYDYAQDMVYNEAFRRSITIPTGVASSNVPPVYFLDLAPDDYLPAPVPVQFSVDMAGAVGTDGHEFVPVQDAVYINGVFANGGGTYYPQTWYPWTQGINPIPAPAGYQMIEVGSTTIYTNTIILPAGTPVALQYQYGMDPYSLNGGPMADESTSGNNHFRVVRSTDSGVYTMPTDTFGNQYQEPFFSPGNIGGIGSLVDGNLKVAPAAGGLVAVSWLGRPGAQLQVSSNLAGGGWQSLAATDGTNWTAGYSSTNGLVSQTNWPAGGNAFFRLVKP